MTSTPEQKRLSDSGLPAGCPLAASERPPEGGSGGTHFEARLLKRCLSLTTSWAGLFIPTGMALQKPSVDSGGSETVLGPHFHSEIERREAASLSAMQKGE